MALYTDNFNRANGDLTSPWAAVVSTGCTIDTNAVKRATGSGYGISALTGETFTDDQDAKVTLSAVNTADYAGVGVRFDGSGNGYLMICHFLDGRVYLWRFDAGTPTSLGYISSTPVATDTIKLGVVGSTFTYYLNDVSQGTWSDSTYTSGAPAIGFNPGGSNSTTVDDFEAEGWGGASASVDDVDTDETLEDGQAAVVSTHSGFTTNPDSGKLVSGSFEYALTNFSSNATTATGDIQDIANLSGSQAGAPFTSASHSINMQLDNSVDVESASLAITLNPAAGWAVQEVTGVNNATNGCVTKNFTGTPPNTSQIAYETASNTSLDAQALLTTDIINGTINMRYWDAVTGIWEPFTVTLVDGAIASISSRGGSVRSSIRNVIKSDIIDITR